MQEHILELQARVGALRRDNALLLTQLARAAKCLSAVSSENQLLKTEVASLQPAGGGNQVSAGAGTRGLLTGGTKAGCGCTHRHARRVVATPGPDARIPCSLGAGPHATVALCVVCTQRLVAAWRGRHCVLSIGQGTCIKLDELNVCVHVTALQHCVWSIGHRLAEGQLARWTRQIGCSSHGHKVGKHGAEVLWLRQDSLRRALWRSTFCPD